MARTLRDRLVFLLDRTRKELLETTEPIPDSDLDWAPQPGMRTYRGQLVEIGATELETSSLLRTGRALKFAEAEAGVTGATVAELLGSLQRIRKETLGYLAAVSDEDLRAPVPIPQGWWEYMGDKEIEREELVRWIVQHEYYHLAQVVSYRWAQGHDPYS